LSTPVSYLVDDAAQAIGDPNKERVSLAMWKSIFNRSLRELCEKANVLKSQDVFTIGPVTRYPYPEHMTVLSGVEVSDTPSDEGSFRTLDEIFEDEFRELTSRRFPTASLPTYYFATSSFYYLIPMAENQIVDGGCTTHFGLPERVEDITTALLETPDFTQDYVIRRMIIHGMEARNRWEEAKTSLALWNADVETLQDKMDDRSLDRRSSIAPRRNRLAGMR
jgi:hypothetical protein